MRDLSAAIVSWSEFFARHMANAEWAVDRLRDDLGEVTGPELSSAFAGCSGVLARGILFKGTAALRSMVAAYHPHVPRVMRTLAANGRAGESIAHWILDFVLLAECMGTPLPTSIGRASLAPLLTKRRASPRELDDVRKRSLAFTALALGDTESARAFITAKPKIYRAPVDRFEFNQFELIRYLAAAIDERHPADWFEPAWSEYFQLFPVHMAANAAAWTDLFKLARIVAVVSGTELSGIAESVHASAVAAATVTARTRRALRSAPPPPRSR